jgi:hypothetical protein
MDENNPNNILLSWTTPEHVHHERSIDFYWIVGLISVVVSVLAFILKDGLFGFLALIGGGLYCYSNWKKPNNVDVIITDKEIAIGYDVFLISKIQYFRIIKIKDEYELVLNIRQTYQPVVSICVPNDMVDKTRELLGSMIEESETIVPHIGRRFMARYKI